MGRMILAAILFAVAASTAIAAKPATSFQGAAVIGTALHARAEKDPPEGDSSKKAELSEKIQEFNDKLDPQQKAKADAIDKLDENNPKIGEMLEQIISSLSAEQNQTGSEIEVLIDKVAPLESGSTGSAPKGGASSRPQSKTP